MLQIVQSQQSHFNLEAQAFFAEEPRTSAVARIIAFVAALDAASLVFALLAA